MPYWIKERRNPQTGTYYRACGKLPVKEGKLMASSLYGSNTMHRFESEAEYETEVARLKTAGERIQ